MFQVDVHEIFLKSAHCSPYAAVHHLASHSNAILKLFLLFNISNPVSVDDLTSYLKKTIDASSSCWLIAFDATLLGLILSFILPFTLKMTEDPLL